MDVNFIITCFNREDYWPHLKRLILSYKKIRSHVAFCYNGTKNIPADFKCKNRGMTPGDCDMITGGYYFLRNNGVKNWIKLSVDSWLVDESKIISIFEAMEKVRAVYGGCRWDTAANFSTDIMFVREDNFQFMREFVAGMANEIGNHNIEWLAGKIARKCGRFYMIPERDGVPVAPGKFRHVVPALGWCMFHDLQKNIDFMNEYRVKNGSNQTRN